MMASYLSRNRFYLIAFTLWLITLAMLTGATYSVWIQSWSKWDAQSYESIWQIGYDRADPRHLVFPPGYPLLVGVFSKLTFLSFGAAAMLINSVSFFFAALISAQLLSKRLSLPAEPMFILTLSSPVSYFIFAPYSDSVFFLSFWILLWFALERPQSFSARIAEFLVMLVAPWIRLTGFALTSWAILRRVSALAAVVSLAGWLFLNWHITGDALYFVKAQELFSMPSGGFAQGFLLAIQGLFPIQLLGLHPGATEYLQFNILPLIYFFGLLATAVWLWRKNERLMGISVLAILLLSHNQGAWRSVVRYDLPLLPCLYAGLLYLTGLKLKTKSQFNAGFILGSVAALQFVLQVYFAILFKTNHWAF